MNELLIENSTFQGKDFVDLLLNNKSINGCIFENCSFKNVKVEGTVLFSDCTFKNCSLSFVETDKKSLLLFEKCTFGKDVQIIDTVVDEINCCHSTGKENVPEGIEVHALTIKNFKGRKIYLNSNDYLGFDLGSCDVNKEIHVMVSRLGEFKLENSNFEDFQIASCICLGEMVFNNNRTKNHEDYAPVKIDFCHIDRLSIGKHEVIDNDTKMTTFVGIIFSYVGTLVPIYDQPLPYPLVTLAKTQVVDFDVLEMSNYPDGHIGVEESSEIWNATMKIESGVAINLSFDFFLGVTPDAKKMFKTMYSYQKSNVDWDTQQQEEE